MSNGSPELTPQQVADLVSIAERYRARAEKMARPGAEVRKNQWSADERKLNGLRNSRGTLINILRLNGPEDTYHMDLLADVLDQIAQLEANGVFLTN